MHRNVTFVINRPILFFFHLQSDNTAQALEQTLQYTTESLASVAYQINILARDFLEVLDTQAVKMKDIETKVSHLDMVRLKFQIIIKLINKHDSLLHLSSACSNSSGESGTSCYRAVHDLKANLSSQRDSSAWHNLSRSYGETQQIRAQTD